MSASRFWLLAWQRRGWLNHLLLPLSKLAQWVWLIRLRLTQPEVLPVPVIVVGNLWPGGAGKTPVVMALVEHLQSVGIAVGVLSRGHGRKTNHTALLSTDSSAHQVGDEPLLIHQKTGAPVAVGAQRVDAAHKLLAAHPEIQVLVSDDGLQHLKLAHDLALVILDERGLGNGWMLPAGPLREPWPRPPRARLREWLLSNGLDQTGALPLTRSLSAWATNGLGQRVSLEELSRSPVAAVCGIAKPDSFFQALRQAGLNVVTTQAWPDHHSFNNWLPVDALPSNRWICTEKDAVKLWAKHPEVWAVSLECHLPPAIWPELMQSLKSRLRSNDGHQTS